MNTTDKFLNEQSPNLMTDEIENDLYRVALKLWVDLEREILKEGQKVLNKHNIKDRLYTEKRGWQSASSILGYMIADLLSKGKIG